MAKRFTSTEKWKKRFLRNLKAPYKLLWLYLWDQCNHAGIWEIDFEIARVYIGEEVSLEEAKALFADKIYEFDNGEKWLLVDFIEFQYGTLNQRNPAHKNVIKQLLKYNLLDDDLQLKPLTSSLEAPSETPFKEAIQAPKEEVKEELKEREEEKEKVEKKSDKKLKYPFQTETFRYQWNLWKEYKNKEFNFKFKTLQSEQAALSELNNKAQQDETTAIAILHQSMANGWKGIFQLKNRDNENKSSNTNYKTVSSDYISRIMQELQS